MQTKIHWCSVFNTFFVFNLRVQRRKHQKKIRQNCFENVVSDLKTFHYILSFVTKIRFNVLLKFLREESMSTNTQEALQNLCINFNLILNLGNLFSPPGGGATTINVQGYFQQILQLSSIHECPDTCECPKSAKN